MKRSEAVNIIRNTLIEVRDVPKGFDIDVELESKAKQILADLLDDGSAINFIYEWEPEE